MPHTVTVSRHWCTLAEAFSPFVITLRQGLLQRPVPSAGNDDSLVSIIDNYCDTLIQSIPDILDAMQDLDVLLNSPGSTLNVHEAEAVQEVADALIELCLELLDAVRAVWAAPLPEAFEGLRPLLAALAECPLADVLDRFYALSSLCIRSKLSSQAAVALHPPALSMCIAPDMLPHMQHIRVWLTLHPEVSAALGGTNKRVDGFSSLIE